MHHPSSAQNKLNPRIVVFFAVTFVFELAVESIESGITLHLIVEQMCRHLVNCLTIECRSSSFLRSAHQNEVADWLHPRFFCEAKLYIVFISITLSSSVF